MTTYPNTLWNNRREAASNTLTVLVPGTGSVAGKENRALELYRCFANAYYEIYNNGGGNWKFVRSDFTKVCKAHGVKLLLTDMRAQVRGSGICAELEALGDLVIDAALVEQLNLRVAAEAAAKAEQEAGEIWDRAAARL